MIGHIIVRLHDAEQQQQQQQYCVCVTGDHSTPVVFGDHSHEPVPFTAARVCDVVAAMGGSGQQQLDLTRQHLVVQAEGDSSGSSHGASAAAAGSSEVGRIPLPNVKQPPPLEELLLQAQQQTNRRVVAAAAAAAGAEAVERASSRGEDGSSSAGGSSSVLDLGPWPEAVPQQLLWDAVASFDELSAARGCLGRFTGAGVMPLLRQLAGWS